MMVHIANPTRFDTHFDGHIDENMMQPNAIDLRVAKIWKVDPKSTFQIFEDTKIHRDCKPVELIDGVVYHLPVGVYQVEFEGQVKIGPNHVARIITRSTLNRNGVFLHTGLYDSGFEGRLIATMYNFVGHTMIGKRARLGQLVVMKAESLHLYDGDYGTGKPMEETIYGTK